MRAAGTSLVLAHGHHAAPAFNALFYATIATIIPVLFLAAAVQGRAYQDLLAAAFPARESALHRNQAPAATRSQPRRHPAHSSHRDRRLLRRGRTRSAHQPSGPERAARQLRLHPRRSHHPHARRRRNASHSALEEPPRRLAQADSPGGTEAPAVPEASQPDALPPAGNLGKRPASKPRQNGRHIRPKTLK